MIDKTLRAAGAALLLVTGVAATSASGGGFEPVAWDAETPERPSAVLFQGATVWTSAEAGILESADVLVRDGRIAAIGQDLRAPSGAQVIDAEGMHITPGLVDAHSHTAIRGGVNEFSNIVTSEVRIADVINPTDINIYRQLAGGLTAANLLHGSANAIGGQNAVIKLRWGAGPEEMLFDAAPQGIKFALGENPKQSNFSGGDRYPQTRQGVEQAIRTAFQAAEDYRDEHERFNRSKGANRVPPRRDYQLEALVEIMAGERLVHGHSYRADEILMLLRVAEDYGFRMATFQHVNEGYKVADELAAHGAGASTFSDWWAYKYEVVDAIPYNAALMAERGVLTSVNSDSDELARRLNLEAAKSVRYGGLSEIEALKLVTINPAEQLGVGDRIGSLEVGKDADLVLWTGHPLSTLSRVEQTWLDGRRYFDRETDLASREALRAERLELVAKVRAEAESSADEEADGDDGEGAEETEPQDSPPERNRVFDDGHGHHHGHPNGVRAGQQNHREVSR